MSEDRRELLEALQDRLGYRFEDVSLLERALVHRSFAHERQRWDEHGLLEDNERLEFLGDGVLYLAVSEFLFHGHPGADEGQLSKRRRFQIKGSQQAVWGRQLLLDDPALLLRGRIPPHEEARGAAKRLEDAFEAVLGAIFLDGGFEAVRGVLLPLMRNMDGSLRSLREPKGRLQEILQARGLPLPVYEIVAEGGPAHQKWFEARIMVTASPEEEPQEWGRGRSQSKKRAETLAAKEAWNRLVEEGLLEGDPVE
jgi:ribonuclease-3